MQEPSSKQIPKPKVQIWFGILLLVLAATYFVKLPRIENPFRISKVGACLVLGGLVLGGLVLGGLVLGISILKFV